MRIAKKPKTVVVSLAKMVLAGIMTVSFVCLFDKSTKGPIAVERMKQEVFPTIRNAELSMVTHIKHGLRKELL